VPRERAAADHATDAEQARLRESGDRLFPHEDVPVGERLGLDRAEHPFVRLLGEPRLRFRARPLQLLVRSEPVRILAELLARGLHCGLHDAEHDGGEQRADERRGRVG